MADNNKLLSIVHKKFPALKELDVKVTQGKGKGFAETFISGFDGADADTVEFRDLSNNLTDEQFDQLYASTVIHEKPLTNALGENFKEVLTKEKVIDLFKIM